MLKFDSAVFFFDLYWIYVEKYEAQNIKPKI